MPAYQPGTPDGSAWSHYTTTRPFKRCTNCDASMISSDPGTKCSRCELAEQKGPMVGPSYYPSDPTQPAKANNTKRDRPGPKDQSNDDYNQ